MSKAVLISIKPEWCQKIVNGEKIISTEKTIEVKKIEVRKTRPKIETPFPCYIYCTNDRKTMLEKSNYDGSVYLNSNIYYPHKMDCSLNGKVIGEFVCDYIVDYWYPFMYSETDCSVSLTELCCLSVNEVWEYGKGKTLYGWHISDLKIYDKPKELSEFRTYNPGVVWENGYPVPTHEIKRPPQSWCYVEEAL